MERTIITTTVKEGTIWTQVFDQKGAIVSSFISDDEIQAMRKTAAFLKQYPEYMTYSKERMQQLLHPNVIICSNCNNQYTESEVKGICKVCLGDWCEGAITEHYAELQDAEAHLADIRRKLDKAITSAKDELRQRMQKVTA